MDVNRLYAIGSVKEDFLGYVAIMDEPHFLPVDVLTGVLAFCKFTESLLQTSFFFHSFFTTTEHSETGHDRNTNKSRYTDLVEGRKVILNMQEIMIPKRRYYSLSRHYHN